MKKSQHTFIVRKRSRIHGLGIFARYNIPKNTEIIEYLGEKVTKKESDRRSELTLERAQKNSQKGMIYIFDLNKRYDLDGNVPWNTARHINHSCDPNCEVHQARGHIWIVAKRDIQKGEELSYNYGYDLANYHDHPCQCGKTSCIGYILDRKHWHRLKKSRRKKKNGRK